LYYETFIDVNLDISLDIGMLFYLILSLTRLGPPWAQRPPMGGSIENAGGTGGRLMFLKDVGALIVNLRQNPSPR
jgi:hypothetical protein